MTSDEHLLTPSEPRPTQPPRWLTLAAWAAIVLATFVAYIPSMSGGFIWDDDAHVPRPEMRSIEGLRRIWFDIGATQQYYPLLFSWFWLQWQAFGDAPTGYHVVNVLLHLGCAYLLYVILRRLRVPGALLAAAIFALHPVHVESVAWITEQKNTFSAVFYFAAMLAYLRFDERRVQSEERRITGEYWLALVLFILALLSKTVTATLPAALLVIFWWKRGTIRWRDVWPLVPFFVLAVLFGLLTTYIERHGIGAEGADFELSLVERTLLAGRIIWFYIGKLLWPAELMFFYPRWEIDAADPSQWIYTLGVIALLAALWFMRRRARAPLAAVLLYVGTLFPVLGFLNVYWFQFSYVGDHLQYLASPALIALAAAGLALAFARRPQLRWIGVALGVALVIDLAIRTSRQSLMYGDMLTHYRAIIAKNPNSWLALNNLGNELLQAGQLQESMDYFRDAARVRPVFAEAHNNLGNALLQAGQHQQAVEAFQEALRIRPNYPEVHNSLGSALLAGGRLPEAIEQFELALTERPGYPEAHNNLANAYQRSGKLQEAINHYQHAIDLRPDYADSHCNLGTALREAGRPDEAIEHYRQAVHFRPNYPLAYFNWGNLLLFAGRDDEAIEKFQTTLRLKPDMAEAHTNLGAVLVKNGRAPEAVPHYQEAMRLRPDSIEAAIECAQVHDLAGQFDEATAAARKALDLARAQGRADWVERIEATLKARAAAPPARQ